MRGQRGSEQLILPLRDLDSLLGYTLGKQRIAEGRTGNRIAFLQLLLALKPSSANAGIAAQLQHGRVLPALNGAKQRGGLSSGRWRPQEGL